MSDITRFVALAKENPAAIQAALNDKPESLLNYLQEQFPDDAITRQVAEQVAAVVGLDAKPYVPLSTKKSEPNHGKIIYLVSSDAPYKDEDLQEYLQSRVFHESQLPKDIRLASIQNVEPQDWRQVVRGRQEDVHSDGARQLLRPVPQCCFRNCNWFGLNTRGLPDKNGFCSLHQLYENERRDAERKLQNLQKWMELLEALRQSPEEWRWWFVLNSPLAEDHASSVLNLPESIASLLEAHWSGLSDELTVGNLVEAIRCRGLKEVSGIGPERLQLVWQVVERYVDSITVPPLNRAMIRQILGCGKVHRW